MEGLLVSCEDFDAFSLFLIIQHAFCIYLVVLCCVYSVHGRSASSIVSCCWMFGESFKVCQAATIRLDSGSATVNRLKGT